MVDRIIHTIEKFELLQNGDRVIIALSGGADSVALLHTLCSIKEKYNLTLFAAHLNHGLRGGEADRDEKFCKSLCKKHKVEFFVKRMNIRAIAEEQKISDELCGRNERYNFLCPCMMRLGLLRIIGFGKQIRKAQRVNVIDLLWLDTFRREQLQSIVEKKIRIQFVEILIRIYF